MKVIFSLALLISSLVLFGQSDTVYIFRSNFSIQRIEADRIDSIIVVSNNGYELHIKGKNETLSILEVGEVDSIVFYKPKITRKTVTDVDGNTYPVVVIGNEVWMAANLKTTKYNDGTSILNVTSNFDDADTAAYCWHNNDKATNFIKNGALYNFPAVLTQKICPLGWRLPTDTEWDALISIAGNDSYKLKATTEWDDTKAGTDDFGFNAYPSGSIDGNGTWSSQGGNTSFWTSTKLSGSTWGYNYGLTKNNTNIFNASSNGTQGYSVRCIHEEGKNNLPPPPTNPLPRINSNNQSANPMLKWQCEEDPDGEEITFNLYLDTYNASTLVASNLKDLKYFATGLSSNTKYFWKIEATDGEDAIQSNVWSFTTHSDHILEPLMDLDSNFYNTVKIGSQIWTSENLKTTTYNDSSKVTYVSNKYTWDERYNESYCWSSYFSAEQRLYEFGALYNYYAASSGKLCPSGWHVPSDDDWKTLELSLGLSSADANTTGYRGTNEGAKLATEHSSWQDGSLMQSGDLETSGFSVIAAGSRTPAGDYSTSYKQYANFWSSNGSYKRSLYYNGTNINRGTVHNLNGFSVRCVKD